MDWDEAEQAGEDMNNFMRIVQAKARDHARTPMQVCFPPHPSLRGDPLKRDSRQWDSTRNAGFTTGTPWMRVHDDFRVWNVQRQMWDPESVWSFWRRALGMRKAHQVLVSGPFWKSREPPGLFNPHINPLSTDTRRFRPPAQGRRERFRVHAVARWGTLRSRRVELFLRAPDGERWKSAEEAAWRRDRGGGFTDWELWRGRGSEGDAEVGRGRAVD